MPNQTLQQAQQELDATPLGPEVRRQRERELQAIRDREVKDRGKQFNDRIAQAKTGYGAVNDEQDALDDEYDDLASQEGRIPAAEYQRRLEELHARQQQLEQRRSRHRTALLNVGEAVDALEEDPDAVIDDFYQRYPALPKPTQSLSW
jgi:chromosome segregation ATPase